MREEANNHSMTQYDKGALLVRKDYQPLVVYHGKREYSYFVTMPPTDNIELENRFDSWFHDDFVQIVLHIVEKRAILLEHGQKQPSQAGGKKGWYLPLAVLLELQKMWTEENVPMMMELIRPTDLIYGKGWTKRDIVNVIEEYLCNNPTEETTLEHLTQGNK